MNVRDTQVVQEIVDLIVGKAKEKAERDDEQSLDDVLRGFFQFTRSGAFAVHFGVYALT